jgi:hypothetical protein
VGKAAKLVLPAWARTVIPGPAGAPLLYAGEHDGRRAAVLAFLPRNSDLPLQVAFPILLANLTGELFGGSTAPADAVVPGDPVSLPFPDGASTMVVTRPDGSTVELAPATAGAASVLFSQTELLGVYSAQPVFPTPTAGPSGAPTVAPTTTPGVPATLAPGSSPTPGASAGTADPNAPVRFAVDLFDPGESDISPGSPSAIAALGRQPGASGGADQPSAPSSQAPGSSVTPGVAGTDKPPVARDELWVLVVLVVLGFLLAEWLVYHRDAVTRLWRGLRRAADPEPGPAGRVR